MDFEPPVPTDFVLSAGARSSFLKCNYPRYNHYHRGGVGGGDAHRKDEERGKEKLYG